VPHLHGCVVFENPCSCKLARKTFAGATIASTMSNNKQASEHCKKGNPTMEDCEQPMTASAVDQAQSLLRQEQELPSQPSEVMKHIQD